MDKDKFSKRYQQKIEKAGSNPWPWPMPKKRSDLLERKRQLRMRELQVPSNYGLSARLMIEETKEALQAKNTRRSLFWTIAVFIVAVVGVVATIYFGSRG